MTTSHVLFRMRFQIQDLVPVSQKLVGFCMWEQSKGNTVVYLSQFLQIKMPLPGVLENVSTFLC